MEESTKISILAWLLAGLLLFGKSGAKSNCDISSKHVHKYIKPISESIVLERYVDSEKLSYHGFEWTSDYMTVNKEDEALYGLLSKSDLFDGVTNWDYLYNKMYNNHDYLMFYYEYSSIESTTSIDADGNVSVSTRPVTYSGWHRDPNSYDNTGDVRVYHHRYYGYRVIRKNDEIYLARSPLADDINDIIEEYPYFNERCTKEVYKQYKYNKSDLPNLRVEDFHDFDSPDLSSKELVLK